MGLQLRIRLGVRMLRNLGHYPNPLSFSFVVLAEKQIEPALCCHGDWGEPHDNGGGA